MAVSAKTVRTGAFCNQSGNDSLADNNHKALSLLKPAFVTWDKKLIELGKVKRGEKREMFFEFTNTSGQDIQIDIVDACSCTTVDFPRGVITPGGKGKLDVVFDSTEKEASETIGITVVFKNTDENGFQKIESVEYKFEL